MKTEKIIVAGALVRRAIYPRAAGREPARIRREKRKASTEAQQRLNAKYSWEKLELMLAANFVPGDLFATLTFDDDHLPEDRKTAAARLKKFRQQLTEIRKARGEECRMIWTIENAHGSGRWHVHLAVNATGNDFSDILRCWLYGSDVEILRIELSREKNYESLARYMCKEERERPGLRSWSYSRNCRHPEVETRTVPDDADIQAPDDAIILEDETKQTEWASYHYIKYLTTAPAQLRSRRPRQRKKKE